MRKYLMIALAAFALFSCNKEREIVDCELQPKSLKYVFNVAEKPSFDGNTRAVKSSWVDGDQIFIVFDDADPSKVEDFMILTYDGEEWVVTQEPANNKPKDTGGTFSALYCEIPESPLLAFSDYDALLFESEGYGQYMNGNGIPYTIEDGTLTASIALDFEKVDGMTFVQLRITDLPASTKGWTLDPDDYLHEDENDFDVFLPAWLHNKHMFSYLSLSDDVAGPGYEFRMGDRDDGYYLYFGVQQKADDITFTITNRDNNDKYRKTFSKKVSGKCAAITFKGPQLDAGGTPTNGWKKVPRFGLTFADSAVEAICVENWDTDKDGYLTYTEAAAVTDLGDVFTGNTEITSFDELQFFTGLTSLTSSAFTGCASLKSVIIPNTVTLIQSGAFRETGLTSITIPASVTCIETNPFDKCTALASIQVDEGNEYFDSRENCNAIIVKQSYSYIWVDGAGNDVTESFEPNWMIVGCKNSVIPDSVTTIYAAFQNCTGLVSIIIPDSVTTIASAAFWGCTGLKTIDFGNCLQIISPVSFSNCTSLEEIVLPASLTSMLVAFTECTALKSVTVNAVTPPSAWGAFPAYIDFVIYVPAESLDAYKSATGWDNYADKIQVIPTGVDMGSGLKWATINVGATSETDGGSLLSWSDGNAAVESWGDNWRLPTKDEWQSLIDDCSWTWDGSKNGMTVTSTNGNSIFLPAAGAYDPSDPEWSIRGTGFYWSSSPDYYFELEDDGSLLVINGGSILMSIRPVLK